MYEAVKKDLDELSTAVRSEATNVGTILESTLKVMLIIYILLEKNLFKIKLIDG